MRFRNTRKPQPPRHGEIKLSAMKVRHAKDHLRLMTEGAAEVANYGDHEATGYDSPRKMAPGEASGADYQTTSVNDAR